MGGLRPGVRQGAVDSRLNPRIVAQWVTPSRSVWRGLVGLASESVNAAADAVV